MSSILILLHECFEFILNLIIAAALAQSTVGFALFFGALSCTRRKAFLLIYFFGFSFIIGLIDLQQLGLVARHDFLQSLDLLVRGYVTAALGSADLIFFLILDDDVINHAILVKHMIVIFFFNLFLHYFLAYGEQLLAGFSAYDSFI